ncbi:hypothetical protein SDC9_53920 [bioreactor metagenome]|uniref:Uncharacterized protein n=1 Tax=bioreactor metagenome TaxID=1076179 RepID=A0A644X0B4_9ZZZZ
MTNAQKSMIAEMRRQGCSYAKIAQSLSISENTIKTFCRRNRLAKDRAANTPVCKQCGCSIEVKDKRKPRQFCSDKCRAAWWYANHKSPSKTEYSLICANCGQPFVSIGSKGRKYCSHRCYINARFGEEHGCNE